MKVIAKWNIIVAKKIRHIGDIFEVSKDDLKDVPEDLYDVVDSEELNQNDDSEAKNIDLEEEGTANDSSGGYGVVNDQPDEKEKGTVTPSAKKPKKQTSAKKNAK